ncbi:MAG: hypothetical protein JWL63_1663 [Rhodocyclales bacterium]|nr:hypothetical protein [Rhodocyclales bacterium]
MQTTRENVKKAIKRSLFIVAFSYGLICLFVYIFPPQYHRCEFYDDPGTLDGGTKEINGKKYRIKMCGTGGNDNGTDDEIELKVLSLDGELLVKRHFEVDWASASAFHQPLQYNKNGITYIDQHQEERQIKIPPGKIDWIRARLPFFN